MTRLEMQSELLMELSEDQQEIVSGGIDLASLTKTDFSQETLATLVNVQSGPAGSSVTRAITAEDIDTSAFEALALNI